MVGPVWSVFGILCMAPIIIRLGVVQAVRFTTRSESLHFSRARELSDFLFIVEKPFDLIGKRTRFARAFILQQNLVRNDVRRHQCGAKMQTQRLYPRRASDCAVPANIYKKMTWFTASAQSFAQWCLLSIYTRVMCMFDMPLCSAYTSITLRMQHQSHLI